MTYFGESEFQAEYYRTSASSDIRNLQLAKSRARFSITSHVTAHPARLMQTPPSISSRLYKEVVRQRIQIGLRSGVSPKSDEMPSRNWRH
jgi:hypothetical protein